jgi:hypothetical protein
MSPPFGRSLLLHSMRSYYRRTRQTTRVTLAMAAGLTDYFRELQELVGLSD